MNKKVMALAVAGALAVPGVALAQVTLSGGFRMGIQQHSISNANVGNAAAAPAAAFGAAATTVPAVTRTGLNTSETRVIDNVSQIIFSAREDLGGGLTAIGRYEWRPTIDGSGAASGQAPNGTGCASNWVGIESSTMGTLRLGCVNTYAGAGGTGGPYTADNFLALTSNVGLMQQGFRGEPANMPTATGVGAYAAGQLRNFGQGRQGSSVTWNSPSWNGFGLDLVWSSNNSGNDSDLASVSGARKGQAWILAPKFTSGAFSAQYIYFNNKEDGATAVLARDWIANKIWATYNFTNGFSLTGAWNSVRLTNSAPGPGALLGATGGNRLSDANKWMLSGQYLTGPHRFTGDYTRSNSDKVIGGGTGARQWALAYGYAFSKRTDVGLSYTRVNNDALAAFGPQDTGAVSLGGNNDFGQAGETYTIWGVNLHHKF